MENKQHLTRFMQRWHDIKKEMSDVLILVRCGDFYEAYNIDAKVCHDTLGLPMTHRKGTCPTVRNNYAGAIAGFPSHALDIYLPRIIRSGNRIAIGDKSIFFDK